MGSVERLRPAVASFYALNVREAHNLSDRTTGTVKERVVQVHLPAPMGTCVPLTGGISKTGGVCSENKTR